MPRSISPFSLAFACLALLLAKAPLRAQHGGGDHPGGGGGMGPGMPGNSGFAGAGYGPRDYSRMNSGPPHGGPDMHGSLQLGPPGRWWDDKHIARDLKLRPEQQRRMDSIFEANKPSLLNRLAVVQQEETRMEAATHVRTPDENALYLQIDRVWQARADLEKARTHFLLQLRQEMDADQIARLEEHRAQPW